MRRTCKYIPGRDGIVLTPDSNGRCDIYGPAPVGHATITAPSRCTRTSRSSGIGQQDLERAHQDDELRVEQGPELHPEERRTRRSASRRSRTCAGNPVDGAQVEFSAAGVPGLRAHDRGLTLDKVPPYDTTGQAAEHQQRSQLRGRHHERATAGRRSSCAARPARASTSCRRTSAPATVATASSAPSTSTRRRVPRAGPPRAPPTGLRGGGSTGSTGGSTGSSGATAPVTVAAPVAVSSPVPTAATAPAATAKTMTLASARVVKIGKNRVLLVRVNGAAKTAKLHITMIGKVARQGDAHQRHPDCRDQQAGSRPEPEAGSVGPLGEGGARLTGNLDTEDTT